MGGGPAAGKEWWFRRAGRKAEEQSGAADHDFSGFDEGHGLIARFEGELADGVGGDDGGDALLSDGEDDLCEQTFNSDFKDGAEQLVTAADAGRAGMGQSGRGDGQKLVEGFDGDAVVSAGSFDGPDAAGEDPVFEGRIADADFVGSLARCEQVGSGHWEVEVPPREYFTRFSGPQWESARKCAKNL